MDGASACPTRWSGGFNTAAARPATAFSSPACGEPDSGNDLAEAVSFTAEENGERLFTGVVDECERGWDTAGGTLTVAGRGMAARLLDNEALGADYQVATVEDILRDHVAPTALRPCGGRSCRRCRASRWTRGAASGRWSMNSAAITGELPPV